MNDYQNGAWPYIRVIHCTVCDREFRGIYPEPVRDRHQAEHRAQAVAAVASS